MVLPGPGLIPNWRGQVCSLEPENSPAARWASSYENSFAKKERIMNIVHRTPFGKQSPCSTSHPSA